MTPEQTIRDALIEHSGEYPDGVDRCGECGLRMDSPHAEGCHVPEALAALKRLVAEHDAALREAELSRWPQEAAQEYHRMKVYLPAALARAEAAEKEAEMYRREAAHARTLASGWAEANAERSRAEAAEKERDEALSRAACQLEGSIRLKAAAESRCATLEAALREIADLPLGQHFVLDPDDDAREIARDALAAATPPAETGKVVVKSPYGEWTVVLSCPLTVAELTAHAMRALVPADMSHHLWYLTCDGRRLPAYDQADPQARYVLCMEMGCPTCGTTPCPDCQDAEKEGTP